MECPTGILIEFDEEVVEKKLPLPDVTRFSVPSTPVIVSTVTCSASKRTLRGLTYCISERSDEGTHRNFTYIMNDGSDEDVSFLENETFDFDYGSPVRSDGGYEGENVFNSFESPHLPFCRNLLHNEDAEPKLSSEELTELFNEASQLASQLESQSVLEKSRTWKSADDVNCETPCFVNCCIVDKGSNETNCNDCQTQDVKSDTSACENMNEGEAMPGVMEPIVEEADQICSSCICEDALDMVKDEDENVAENLIQNCSVSPQLSTLKPFILKGPKLVDYSCDTPDLSPANASDASLERRRPLGAKGLNRSHGHADKSITLCNPSLDYALGEESTLPNGVINGVDLNTEDEHNVEESTQQFSQAEAFSESPLATKVRIEECNTPEMDQPRPSCVKYPTKMPRNHSTPILQLRPPDLSRTVTKSTSASNVRELRMRAGSSSSLSDVNQRNTSIASTISDEVSPVSSGSSTSSMPTFKSGLAKPKMLGLLRPGFSTRTSSSFSSLNSSADKNKRVAAIPEGSRSQPLQRKTYQPRTETIQRPGPNSMKTTEAAKVPPTFKNQINRKVLPSQGGVKVPAPVRRVQSFRDSSTKPAPPVTAKAASKAPTGPRIPAQNKMPPPQSQVPSAPNAVQRGRVLSDASSNGSFGALTPRRLTTSTPQQTSPKLSPVFNSATPVRQRSRLSLAPTPRSEQLSRRRSVATTVLKEQPGEKSNRAQNFVRNSASPINTQNVAVKPKSQQITTSNKENVMKQKPK